MQNTGQGYAERLVGPEMMWGDELQQRRRVNNFPSFNRNGKFLNSAN